jgi:mRNA interferase YafQ
MLESKRGTRFKREFALAEKRGRDMSKIIGVMDLLINEQPLPPGRQDHPLKGTYKDSRECHIRGIGFVSMKLFRPRAWLPFSAPEPIPTCSKNNTIPLCPTPLRQPYFAPPPF